VIRTGDAAMFASALAMASTSTIKLAGWLAGRPWLTCTSAAGR